MKNLIAIALLATGLFGALGASAAPAFADPYHHNGRIYDRYDHDRYDHDGYYHNGYYHNDWRWERERRERRERYERYERERWEREHFYGRR